MIPKHTCGPLCDGQKYNVEEGTHTLETLTTPSADINVIRRIFEQVEILRAMECPDVTPSPMVYDLHGRLVPRYPGNTKTWLVTVREKEPA